MLGNKKNKLQILGQDNLNIVSDEPKDGNRRDFLKVLGAGAIATGATACADPAAQKIFPYAKGEPEQVPGVAMWYNSTCTECSAGCGISVRTREGRAVKIEGNNEHPVNKGGLCALGQSSLQDLYNPDRIRQPLIKKEVNGKKVHVPVTWDEAIAKVKEAVKEAKNKKVFLTSEINGTQEKLVKAFSKGAGFDHVVYEPLSQTQVQEAAKLTFGVNGIPKYNFDKADVLVNFGADFLETWISPCEYARDWGKSRKSKHPLRAFHIEPRLSLTAANADSWIMNNPGSELSIALYIARKLIEKGKAGNLQVFATNKLKKLAAKLSTESILEQSGVSLKKLNRIVDSLVKAKSPLVIAGATSASGTNGLALCVVTNLINLLLGSVSKTITLEDIRELKTDFKAVDKLISQLDKAKVDVLMVSGTNPEFTLSTSSKYGYAKKKAKLLVSLSAQMDETAKASDVILPLHSSLEEWGDDRSTKTAYSLKQPVMSKIYDTKGFGDTVLSLGKELGVSSLKASSYLEYLKAEWMELHKTSSESNISFTAFWKKSLERGGYYRKLNFIVKPEVSKEAFDVDFSGFKVLASSKSGGDSDLVLYPFASVKTFDGRAANRPWLQEVPDPITSVVWDTWAEINPKTASSKGLKTGDSISLTNTNGQLNIPVYVTKHVKEGIVAVPIGNGHTEYGRYASMVQGGNVYDLLPNLKASSMTPALLTAGVALSPGRKAVELVKTQITDKQGKRHIAQFETMGSKDKSSHSKEAYSHGSNKPMKIEHVTHEDSHHGDGGHGHGGGHHEPKQVYLQRKSPLYHWVLTVDLAACTGCQACVVACSAENNIPVVGKEVSSQGREMSWLRIERYVDEPGEGDNHSEELVVNFMPVMCQHCQNAPCEPVCPVYATYHNEEGLNAMVYNRCVGTRYCGNNCSYKVRRYNWFEFDWPEPLNWQLNPDVTKRTAGVMEKCSFCVQRINEGKDKAKDLGRLVEDGDITPACVQSCPTQALTFGNFNDKTSKVYELGKSKRAYKVLDHHLNTQPSVIYLKNRKYV